MSWQASFAAVSLLLAAACAPAAFAQTPASAEPPAQSFKLRPVSEQVAGLRDIWAAHYKSRITESVAARADLEEFARFDDPGACDAAALQSGADGCLVVPAIDTIRAVGPYNWKLGFLIDILEQRYFGKLKAEARGAMAVAGLRQTKAAEAAWRKIHTRPKGKSYAIPVDLCATEVGEWQFPLGVYEIAVLLLSHPEAFNSLAAIEIHGDRFASVDGWFPAFGREEEGALVRLLGVQSTGACFPVGWLPGAPVTLPPPPAAVARLPFELIEVRPAPGAEAEFGAIDPANDTAAALHSAARPSAAADGSERVIVDQLNPCSNASLRKLSNDQRKEIKLFCEIREACADPPEPGFACAVAFWKSARLTRPRFDDEIIRLAIVGIDPETLAISFLGPDGKLVQNSAKDMLEFTLQTEAKGGTGVCRVRLYQVLGRDENRRKRQIEDAWFRADDPRTGLFPGFRCQ